MSGGRSRVIRGLFIYTGESASRHPGIVDLVPASLEFYVSIRPERPHHLDLLLRASPAIGEIFVEREVFHRVPADADTEAEAAA